MQPFAWETAPLDRNALLEASAGTGKTYTLEHLVLRLITERGLSLSSILVVTFTNAAAREMQERIRGLLHEEYKKNTGKKKELLLKGIADFDSSSIMTIHGFCARVLQNWPFESGVSLGLEVGTENDLAGQAVWDWFRINDKREMSPFLTAAYQESYQSHGDFRSLTQSLLKLINSDIFHGDALILPGEERKKLLETLINNWEGSRTRSSLDDLAAEAGKLESSQSLLALFKADGMGDGLGPQKAGKLLDNLKGINQFNSINDLLGFLSGAGKEVMNRMIKILASDTFPAGTSPVTRAFNRLVQAYDLEWDRLPPQEIQSSLARFFEFHVVTQVGKDLEGKRIRQGTLTFNDLIDVVHQILTEKKRDLLLKALKNSYKVLLVDEFQDTDQRQWDIFKAVFDNPQHNYFLIGDPKQSIYRFRGADLQVYLTVRNHLPADSLYRLENNYRSHPLLLEGFNLLFPPLFGNGGGSDEIGYSPVGAGKPDVPRLWEGTAVPPPCDFILMELGEEDRNSSRTQSLWLNSCASHIVSLLNDSRNTLEGEALKASHMAVLFENNALCLKMQSLLTQRGVPAVIYQERDIFESRELGIISLFLAGLINKDRGESLRRLLLSPPLALTPGELLFLEDYGYMDSLVLTFRQYRDRVDQGDLIAQFSLFCRLGNGIARFLSRSDKIDKKRQKRLEEPLMERILRQEDGPRIFTNIRHILEILHEEQQRKRLNSEDLNQYIREESFKKHAQDRCHVRLEREGDAVQIMTLHASKGLQFPLVYFGGGLKHEMVSNLSSHWDFNRKGRRCYDFLKNESNREQTLKDEWEERKRLYYVAMTRAESKLFLPLYADWDNFWLSWLYLTITQSQSGQGKEINPFASSRISLEKGLSYRAVKEWISKKETLFRLVQSPPGEEKSRLIPAREWELEEPPLLSLDLDNRHPRLYSFTSLTEKDHGHSGNISTEESSEGADHDSLAAEEFSDTYLDQEEVITPENISGGAALGNVVHRIFEMTDFQLGRLSRENFYSNKDIDNIVQESILFYFKKEWALKNLPVVKEMVWNTLNSPLSDPPRGVSFPPSLSFLTKDQRLHERDFLMGIKEQGRVELNGLFHSLRQGYLKGFIDLVFIWKGQYFIADWKTTRCSPIDREPYSGESVNKIMDDHNYHLQYWIYLSALYLYLSKEGNDFSYERDFGGIFYFFVRAMGPHNSSRGIFYSRPGEEELLGFIMKFIEVHP